MATIYFGTEGSGDERSSEGHDVSIDALREKLAKCELHYFGNRVPIIGEGDAKWMRGYSHVVVHIERNETNAKFPKDGYYLVKDYSPKQCQTDFGIANPR